MFNRVPQNQDDASVEAALKSVLPKLSFGNADVQLKEYDTIEFGSRKLYTIYTPGHTSVSSLD